MLVGYPPFCGDDNDEVKAKVKNWSETFHIPPEAGLSPEAIDLLNKLIRGPNDRLGVNGAAEIKAHPFFRGVPWSNIRNTQAPFIPEV